MYEYSINDVQYLMSVTKANTITLHWSASDYDSAFSDYHLNILGDGRILSHHDNFDVKLSHTWHRNTGNIGISLSCCGDACIYKDGTVTWGTYPPTDKQIETLVEILKATRIVNDNLANNVQTHAEFANIDGYGIYDSDPDMRWDLLCLPQTDMEGGDYIRELSQQG